MHQHFVWSSKNSTINENHRRIFNIFSQQIHQVHNVVWQCQRITGPTFWPGIHRQKSLSQWKSQMYSTSFHDNTSSKYISSKGTWNKGSEFIKIFIYSIYKTVIHVSITQSWSIHFHPHVGFIFSTTVSPTTKRNKKKINKSDIKHWNTLGCPDQYMAPNSNYTGDECLPLPPSPTIGDQCP